MSLNLDGIIAALPTPFDQTGALASDKLKANLEAWNQTDLRGYLILGSTGEFPHLTTDEKLAVIDNVRSRTPSEKLLLVGTGELSTRQTIEMTKLAADRGADAAVVVTPFYYKTLIGQPQLEEHYRRIADASKVPVLVYMIPQFAGVALQASTIASLAAHPNIIGLKESSGDLPALRVVFSELESRRIHPDKFRVMVGAPTIYAEAVKSGAAGGVLAVGCIAPRTCCVLDRLIRQHCEEPATALQQRLAVFSRKTTMNGIGHIKAAMDMTGFYGSLPRLPLSAPTLTEREDIEKAIAESGFFRRETGEQVWVEKSELSETDFAKPRVDAPISL